MGSEFGPILPDESDLATAIAALELDHAARTAAFPMPPHFSCSLFVPVLHCPHRGWPNRRNCHARESVTCRDPQQARFRERLCAADRMGRCARGHLDLNARAAID